MVNVNIVQNLEKEFAKSIRYINIQDSAFNAPDFDKNPLLDSA